MICYCFYRKHCTIVYISTIYINTGHSWQLYFSYGYSHRSLPYLTEEAACSLFLPLYILYPLCLPSRAVDGTKIRSILQVGISTEPGRQKHGTTIARLGCHFPPHKKWKTSGHFLHLEANCRFVQWLNTNLNVVLPHFSSVSTESVYPAPATPP